MTISPWLIYFADLADTLDILFAVITACSIIIILIIACNLDEVSKDDKKSGIMAIKILFSVFIFFGLFFIFLPSSKTIYKMMIIPSAVNSNVVQKLPDELQQYIDKVLKDKDSK
jgi:hypothetical protein